MCQALLDHTTEPFRLEEPLPTVRYGDLALTSTPSADNTGGRVQVVRREPDGTWLRVIDRPEIRPAARPGMSVFIAGAGIGGLTAALSLHAAGIEATVVRAPGRSVRSASASTCCPTPYGS